MISFKDLRRKDHTVLALGSHVPILQAMLDFEYLCGLSKPTLVGIVQSASMKKSQKFFWGAVEIRVPIFASIAQAKAQLPKVTLFINLSSGRRVLESTLEFFLHYPHALGGHIFAEEVPEKHALELFEAFGKDKVIAGPSGVGLLLPEFLKLGAIGGTDINQLLKNNLATSGKVGIISASGGMANELINILARNGKRISVAFTIGGDRFPVNTLLDTLLRMQADKQTEYLVYYGELGGSDEYELVELIKQKKFKKPVYAFIAGKIGETFEKPTQFGHAKAIANTLDESASSKIAALKEAGVKIADSFAGFIKLLQEIPTSELKTTNSQLADNLKHRRSTLFTTSIGKEVNNDYFLLGDPLTEWIENKGLGEMIISSLLGRKVKSAITAQFAEIVLKSFMDHGPQVSGGVNTMVAARAGKDIVSSVASGILTIGSRFGGATNDAARIWFTGVQSGLTALELVSNFSKEKKLILGIGHLKYRVGMPDPRVKFLTDYASKHLKNTTHLDFALAVEKLTSSKKGNLILNVDGAVAAIMLDLLSTIEGYSVEDLNELIEAEFFNALFLVARTIGFSAHYLDQKRNDEGLFRLPNDLILSDN